MEATSLSTDINNIELIQDNELAKAIQSMSKNGGQGLTAYLQEAQDKLYKGVTEQKENTMLKAYGDLERAASTNHSLFYYNQRNHDLNSIQENLYMAQKGDADAILNDRDLAKRQYEINQWTSGNGMDTLFIYKQLLIIVCTVIVLLFIWRQGIISNVMFFGVLFVLICIFVFTIVNRAQYTNFLRDKRFWNRRLFPKYKGIPLNVCGDKTFNPDELIESASDTAKKATDAISNAADNISKDASDSWEEVKEGSSKQWQDFRDWVGI